MASDAIEPNSEKIDESSTRFVPVEVIKYSEISGVSTWWNENVVMRIEMWESPEPTVVISGNPSGLMSLARHLATLAQSEIPDGSHLDFDTYFDFFEEGSLALRIEVEK